MSVRYFKLSEIWLPEIFLILWQCYIRIILNNIHFSYSYSFIHIHFFYLQMFKYSNLEITDMLPSILNQLGAESLTHLKKQANNVTSQFKTTEDDEVPGSFFVLRLNISTVSKICWIITWELLSIRISQTNSKLF